MKKLKIPSELIKLAPFFHDIDLGSGYNTAPDIYRVREMENFLFPPLLRIFGGDLKGLRVLDVGCNCGGLSFLAAKYGASEVIGIDSSKDNIDQANAICKYLKIDNVKFFKTCVDEIDEEQLEKFDLIILAGILYHLDNPIGIMSKISRLATSTIIVDSHVHYSANGCEEDIPSWWMLTDTDRNDLEGLFAGDNIKDYLKFEGENEVNYEYLPHQFASSPHTIKDIEFIKKKYQQHSNVIAEKYEIGSAIPGELVMIPNKKALYKLVRNYGFEDILEIVPHRFSSIPYIKKYRIGFIATRRDVSGPFPISVLRCDKPL